MSDTLKDLENAVDQACCKLQDQQTAYRQAKARLRHEQIRLGIIKPDEAVVKFAQEVREKILFYKSLVLRGVLEALCDTLDGKDTTALINLDDKMAKHEPRAKMPKTI